MNSKEALEQSKFILENLKMGCVECEEKAIEFHERVIKDLEVLEILKRYLKIKNTIYTEIITCEIDSIRDEEYEIIEDWLKGK